MVMPHAKILIGWTTVDSVKAARQLATGLIAAQLAACVQVDVPVISHYVWQGKQTQTKEWRLWVKFPADNSAAIEEWLKSHHPYSTPQWLAVEAVRVAKSYQKWILENSLNPRSKKKR